MTIGEFRKLTKDIPDDKEIFISTGDVLAHTVATERNDLNNVEKYYRAQWWDIDLSFDTEKDHILIFVKDIKLHFSEDHKQLI